MTFRPTTLGRAYQLAESGACQSITDIEARLRAEGLLALDDQLRGDTIRRALNQTCAAVYVPAEQLAELG